ncbi:MAG: hypothetical protein ABIW79_04860, partial [Gemmatimonas sp.]
MRRSFRSSGGRTLLRAVMVASLAAAVACSDEETSAAASESATASATASATTDTSVTGMNRPVMVSVTGNADNDFLRMIGDHHRGLLVSTGPTKDKFGA